MTHQKILLVRDLSAKLGKLPRPYLSVAVMMLRTPTPVELVF